MAEVKKKNTNKTAKTSKVQGKSVKKKEVSQLSSDELMEQILNKKKTKSSANKTTTSTTKKRKVTKKTELSSDELLEQILAKKKSKKNSSKKTLNNNSDIKKETTTKKKKVSNDISSDEFAFIMKEIGEMGVSILGGCCGSGRHSGLSLLR